MQACWSYIVLQIHQLGQEAEEEQKWNQALVSYMYEVLKGIVHDYNNIFYDINQKIFTRNGYFQNFSWFKFFVYKLWMIMCIGNAPYATTCMLNKFSDTRIYTENSYNFIRKCFLLNACGEMSFLEESCKEMQKIQSSRFLRMPSIWYLGVCL